jgi:uncharacterized coiled-coil protein SlyX
MEDNPPTTRQQTLANLQKQIDKLCERIDKGYDRIEALISKVDERVRGLERVEAGDHPLINRTLVDHSKTIERHDDLLKAIMLDISALKHTNKILSWLGGIMGSTVIVWVVGQLLGLIK